MKEKLAREVLILKREELQKLRGVINRSRKLIREIKKISQNIQREFSAAKEVAVNFNSG